MCTISVTTTLEEYNVYIEAFDNPKSLLYANEGEDPEPVARQTWNQYMRKHPENPARMLLVRMPPALPHWRVRQVVNALIWTVCQIVHQHARRIERREETP